MRPSCLLLVPRARRHTGQLPGHCIDATVPVVAHQHFVYYQTMNVLHPDEAVSAIAAAIGEPARARMLYSLLDGHARTSTELAVVADVTPSTASVHLQRLKTQRLVRGFAPGGA